MSENIKKDEEFKKRFGIIFLKDISQRVYLCKDSKNLICVVKKVRDHIKIEIQDNEIKAYKKLQHKNIISIFNHFNFNQEKYLMMEYIEGLDLFTWMRNTNFTPISEKKAKIIIKQVLKGLDFCHTNGIIHRDIKLENLIFTKDLKIKIIDFELCCFVDKCCDEQILNCGTHGYNSPQIQFKKSYPACSVDVWCLVFIFILTFFNIIFL